MKRKFTIVCLALFLSALKVFAQDPQFSQFYAAPLMLNPAMTGAFNGNYRFTGIYRSQWASILQTNASDRKGTPAFRTYSASVDFRTSKGFLPKDAFGFGIVLMADKAGAVDFGTTGALGSICYFKSLNRKGTQFISLGLQGGVWQRSLNTAKLNFGSQYDGVGYNSNLPTDPSLYQAFDDKFLMYDVNFGLLWYMKIKDNGSNAYLGFAMDHLTKANESFYRSSNGTAARVPYKITGHGGLKVGLGEIFGLGPKFILVFQGKQWQTNLGTDVKINFYYGEHESDGFSIGAMYRLVGGDREALWKDRSINSESVILNAKVDYKNLQLGAAYDINVGHDKIASRSKGAWEIFASIQGAFNKKKNKTLFCPHW